MSIALSYGTKYIWRHTGTKKSFRLNVCIGYLTATVTALIREQKDTTSHPYFTSCFASTCFAFDLFLCCNLILSIALESSVFTLCSSHLELTKVRRAPNFTTICPEKQGEKRICRQGQARPDSGGSRGGRRPCTSTCTDSLALVCFCDVL